MFFLLLAIGVISFLAHLYANSNKPKPEATALAELDLRRLPVATNEFDEAIVWAACVLDDDPILDIQLIQSFIKKQWGADTVAESGDHPLQRRLRMNNSLATLEPLRAIDSEAFPNRVEGIQKLQLHEPCAGVLLVGAHSSVGGAAASLYLSQLVRSLLNTCPQIVSVYWEGSNTLFTRSKLARALKIDFLKSWPVGVWVSSHTTQNEDGSSTGYTLGLSAMGGVEFEAVNAPESPYELERRLDGLAAYVTSQFGVIYNEDTTGINEIERIKVNKRPSETVHKGWVFQLRYLTPSKNSGWDAKKWVSDVLDLNAPPQPAPPTRRNPHPAPVPHQTTPSLLGLCSLGLARLP